MTRKKTKISFIFATFCLFQGSQTPMALAGGAERKVVWPKKSLTVCWSPSSELLKNTPIFLKFFSDGKKESLDELKILHLPDDLKQLIQKNVTESFSISKTGIEFTGWKTCEETPEHDVVLFYARELAPRPTEPSRYLAAADIGYLAIQPGYEGSKSTSIRINESYLRGYQGENFSDRFKSLIRWRYGAGKANEEVWNTYVQYLFASDMVHEFAHVAGMMHELQKASPAELKAFDISYHQILSSTAVGTPSPLAELYGRFNPFSIMSAFLPSYENAAEKTQLICEIIKGETDPKKEAKDLVLKNEYLETVAKAFGASDAIPLLKKQLCSDQTYLKFHPKYLADHHEFLNEEDQILLKKLYQKPQPTKINPPRAKTYAQKTKYLQTVWKKLIDTAW